MYINALTIQSTWNGFGKKHICWCCVWSPLKMSMSGLPSSSTLSTASANSAVVEPVFAIILPTRWRTSPWITRNNDTTSETILSMVAQGILLSSCVLRIQRAAALCNRPQESGVSDVVMSGESKASPLKEELIYSCVDPKILQHWDLCVNILAIIFLCIQLLLEEHGYT